MKPRLLMSRLARPTVLPIRPHQRSICAPGPLSASHHLPSTPSARPFSSTASAQSWLFPKRGHKSKNPKGRPSIFTGGSSRGTTVVWGDWGLRMADHDRRVSAAQLALGADTIKRRLRGEKFRLYTRVTANIGVYTSGNEQRMGKGKGSFDYWAARVPVNKVLFEVKGEMHEKIVRDALRLAAAKLPGTYEFVKRGDPPVVGITKVTGANTLEFLNRPRRTMPIPKMPEPNLASTADRLPASTPP